MPKHISLGKTYKDVRLYKNRMLEGTIFKKPGDILHSTRGALYVHTLEKIRGALYHHHESLLGPPLLWVKAPGW